MSSRALRKLASEKDSASTDQKDETDNNSSNDDLDTGDISHRFNIFNLLDASSESELSVEENAESQNSQVVEKENDTSKRKKKRRPKKKRNYKQDDENNEICKKSLNCEKYVRPADGSKSNEPRDNERSENEELGEAEVVNLDQLIRILDLDDIILEDDAIKSLRKNILITELKYLDHMNEIKQMFGTDVINAVEDGKKSLIKPHRHGGKPPYIFVCARDGWSSGIKVGLEMVRINSENGLHYFEYRYSQEYSKDDVGFRQSIDTMSLLQYRYLQYPNQVNMMIEMAFILDKLEDHTQAADFTEQALYTLESAFHPTFKICHNDCRMSYLKRENRALFLALFMYMLLMIKRSCYRTALEVNKALLSLDPVNDPLAACLYIDYLSIRSGQYKWLLDFIRVYKRQKKLTKFLNFRYSRAICYFYLNDQAAAERYLIKAILWCPYVITKLADKCSFPIDREIRDNPFFYTSSDHPETKSFKGLAWLYVKTNYHIWKEKSLFNWLHSTARTVLTIINADFERPLFYMALKDEIFCDFYLTNVKRHLITIDATELMQQFTNNDAVILHFDPVPPYTGPSPVIRLVKPEKINPSIFAIVYRKLEDTFNEIRMRGGRQPRIPELIDVNALIDRVGIDNFPGGLEHFLILIQDAFDEMEHEHRKRIINEMNNVKKHPKENFSYAGV